MTPTKIERLNEKYTQKQIGDMLWPIYEQINCFYEEAIEKDEGYAINCMVDLTAMMNRIFTNLKLYS